MQQLPDPSKKGLNNLQFYIKDNYQKTDINKAISWMSEELEELKIGIKKGDTENIKEELAQVFIWCISIANIFDFKLEEIVEKEITHHIQKYPKK